jgi:hypothetical protein
MRLDDLRVDQHDQGIAPLRNIDHDDLFMDVDLRRREANSRRCVHGFGHVGDQLLEGVVEDGDGRGHLVEPGIRVAKNVQ